MSWAPALLLTLGVLFLICCLVIIWPKRRNPVIRQKPQPDTRLYSVKRQ